MKKLSLKNRLSPTLVGMLCGAALAALPSVAGAQLAENWENGVVAGKWISSKSTGNLTYVVDAPPEAGDLIALRSSIADEPAGAACAGRYARETRPAVAGHQYAAGTNIQAVTPAADYCLSAWVRAQPGSRPYLGLNYTGATGMAGVAGGDKRIGLCFAASAEATTAGEACNGVAVAPITRDGTWRWVKHDFKARAASTHAQTSFFNYCGGADCSNTTPNEAFDIDDIRLTAGVCPATPPNTTAPHVPCAGTTPVCTPGDATNNAKCQDCTGNAGAAAPARACPAASPVCVTAGATKGSCNVSCTGDFGTAGAAACAEATPFCVDIAGSTFKECKPCAGNNGSATLPACPAANPTCFTTGAKVGTCGKCTAQADCGGATPRCDIGTGRCTDDCEADADCGDKKSGKICLASTLKCTDGCRGDAAGNGCPDGSKCSSVDLKPGTCTPTAPPDAGPGKPDAGPTPTPDAGPTPEVDSGTGEPPPAEPPAVEEAGGCSMSPSSAGGTATMFVGFGLAVAALGRRRRRN